jgi:hypothetical protein
MRDHAHHYKKRRERDRKKEGKRGGRLRARSSFSGGEEEGRISADP